jgi:hypothetical protein
LLEPFLYGALVLVVAELVVMPPVGELEVSVGLALFWHPARTNIPATKNRAVIAFMVLFFITTPFRLFLARPMPCEKTPKNGSFQDHWNING